MTIFSIGLLVLLGLGALTNAVQAWAALGSACALEAIAEALGTMADAKLQEVEIQAAQVVEDLGGSAFPPGSPLARAVREAREDLTAPCVRCGFPISLCKCRLADVFSERERPTKPDNE